MKNNEPLYNIVKAANAKMWRAVDAKKKHQKMVKHFQKVATHNRQLKISCKNIITLNKTQAFIKFIENIGEN